MKVVLLILEYLWLIVPTILFVILLVMIANKVFWR